MDTNWKNIVWQQLGAAIGALENAIAACPDKLWFDQSKYHQFWYVASHTLFWLDYYLSESLEDFTPPEPFGMEEMDPAGVIPERPYTKEELQTYLEHGREKCRSRIADMTDQKARQVYQVGGRRVDITAAELMLYNMRHVQHHAAQLNLILRLETDSAPGWVFKAKTDLAGN